MKREELALDFMLLSGVGFIMAIGTFAKDTFAGTTENGLLGFAYLFAGWLFFGLAHVIKNLK